MRKASKKIGAGYIRRANRKTYTIGGRTYRVSGTDYSKTEAKRRALRARNYGRYARVKRATRKGKTIYLILTAGNRKG